ncbi:unnamed protein product [Lactuca saligna]|uniref:Protein kinase domain-containing protein n=1 Tax=Lactuca saligna TaxID=75948 RepID=A0AA35VFS7_LACSI|nr:unnamed protein product [Lactuca saligna]
MSVQKQFEHLRIQFEAIQSATNNFAKDHLIGQGDFASVYKGELLLSQGPTMVVLRRLDKRYRQVGTEFWNQILMFSVYKHENLESILGFCDDRGQSILVYDYASKGGLDMHLESNDLMWVQCLKICIGAARGLAFLHNPTAQESVLHRDITSSNILLDENWNAKITDIGFSNVVRTQQIYSFLVTTSVGTFGYTDPEYMETGNLTKESDVYSFGVVLFEVLCGRLCMAKKGDHDPRPLAALVKDLYKQNKLHEIIFGNIKDEINPTSLNVFSSIGFRCLKRRGADRPQMSEILRILETALEYQVSPQPLNKLSNQRSVKHMHWEKTRDTEGAEIVDSSSTNTKSFVMKEFQHLRLPLGFIQEATNNFNQGNFIGEGGFGKVFRGEFFYSDQGETIVGAVKCLDRSKDRADVSFWSEVMLLSTYKHENIISLQGFCDDFKERIIVYKYASNKSLDRYLNDPNLMWTQRLKICLGAACGLEYLHNPKGT